MYCTGSNKLTIISWARLIKCEVNRRWGGRNWQRGLEPIFYDSPNKDIWLIWSNIFFWKETWRSFNGEWVFANFRKFIGYFTVQLMEKLLSFCIWISENTKNRGFLIQNHTKTLLRMSILPQCKPALFKISFHFFFGIGVISTE